MWYDLRTPLAGTVIFAGHNTEYAPRNTFVRWNTGEESSVDHEELVKLDDIV